MRAKKSKLGAEDDGYYQEAISIVRKEGRANISVVQRGLRIGYNRAARMIEAMEKDKIVSELRNDGTREIFPVDKS